MQKFVEILIFQLHVKTQVSLKTQTTRSQLSPLNQSDHSPIVITFSLHEEEKSYDD